MQIKRLKVYIDIIINYYYTLYYIKILSKIIKF
jgi:hypothetical protein